MPWYFVISALYNLPKAILKQSLCGQPHSKAACDQRIGREQSTSGRCSTGVSGGVSLSAIVPLYRLDLLVAQSGQPSEGTRAASTIHWQASHPPAPHGHRRQPLRDSPKLEKSKHVAINVVHLPQIVYSKSENTRSL